MSCWKICLTLKSLKTTIYDFSFQASLSPPPSNWTPQTSCTYMRCFITLYCVGQVYGCTLTAYDAQIWDSWQKSQVIEVCKPYHDHMIETVINSRLEPTPILYNMWMVFEHLLILLLLRSIWTWMCPHTVTTTNPAPDLRELAEILGDGRVQTISIRNA